MILLHWSNNLIEDEPDFAHPFKEKPTAQRGTKRASENTASPMPRKVAKMTRKYTEADLNPTEKDSRCNPDWQLAPFWPVYVSNFKVKELGENVLHTQVSEYFASKGLLTRMIFHEGPGNQYYDGLQKKNKLMDMLVYFVRKQDADDAIRLCHGEMYRGFKLNLFCGRQPDYFDNNRCLVVANGNKTNVEELVQQACVAELPECTGRRSLGQYVAQFATPNGIFAATMQLQELNPTTLKGRFKKQRFVEREVKAEILQKIESTPAFMDMKPRDTVLQSLLKGIIPQVDLGWKNNAAKAIPNNSKNKQFSNGQGNWRGDSDYNVFSDVLQMAMVGTQNNRTNAPIRSRRPPKKFQKPRIHF